MKNLKNFIPHVLVIIGFIIVALAYFSPVLSGKEIFQSDIVQYTGMSKEQVEFRETYNEESYWNNSAFGGMPTYQLGAKYPYNYIKALDSVIRFLPRPADYLFIYFIGFYILLCSFRIKPLQAFFGALAFGFSTYLIVIIGAGHNAKAHAIAYMPMVLAGVFLVFRKKYLTGFILTTIAAALEISTNHFQMTYYLLLLLLIVAIYYTVIYIKQKDFKSLVQIIGIFIVSGILAIGANATNLLATAEYADFSTRSKSELTFNPDGTEKDRANAMSHEYITEYSYGVFETFNLFVPRLLGGGNAEDIGADSNVGDFITSLGAYPADVEGFTKQAPTYWGDQPIVAAPAYIGAIVIFLFILALFTEKRKFKYIFVIGAIVSILLSWGKNFPLTDFMIDNFPMYNKFRAITSIQVIAELCIPALAIIGLASFFKSSKEEQLDALKKSGIVSGAIVVFLFACKLFLDFQGANDDYIMQVYGEIGPSYVAALIEDRQSMYVSDLIRTLFFITLVAAALYFFIKQKLSEQSALIIIGVVMIIDLIMIDWNYVNKSNFVNASQVKNPFVKTIVDDKILQDKSNFRVFDMQSPFNSGRTVFFHQALGGYHAAKPKKVQELYDYQITKQNYEILNMFNVKYVISQDENQNPISLQNPEANGNAWFVSEIKTLPSADEIMIELSKVKTKTTALVQEGKVHEKLKSNYIVDSLASIKLVDSRSNYLKYESNNPNEGVAVFSEIYYPKGWKITIDGKETEMFEADYVLRALLIPGGKHTIEFKFDPEVVSKGSKIALISSILILLSIIGSLVYLFKKRKKDIN